MHIVKINLLFPSLIDIRPENKKKQSEITKNTRNI